MNRTPPEIKVDGFSATLERCRSERIDLTGVPIGLLRMFYQSGVASSSFDQMPQADRALWLQSIMWPPEKALAST
jgi:hypothetical protein